MIKHTTFNFSIKMFIWFFVHILFVRCTRALLLFRNSQSKYTMILFFMVCFFFFVVVVFLSFRRNVITCVKGLDCIWNFVLSRVSSLHLTDIQPLHANWVYLLCLIAKCSISIVKRHVVTLTLNACYLKWFFRHLTFFFFSF